MNNIYGPDSGAQNIRGENFVNKSIQDEITPQIQLMTNTAVRIVKIADPFTQGNKAPAGRAHVPRSGMRATNAPRVPTAISSELKRMIHEGKLKPEEAAEAESLLKLKYSSSLPSPQNPEGKREGTVILWRGCRADQLIPMARTGSAGGMKPPNKDVQPPSEKDAKDQVGETGRLPEFTSDVVVAEGFGRGNFVAAFEVPIKYMTKGSKSESGYVTDPEAPVKLLAFKDGQAFVGLENVYGSSNSKPIGKAYRLPIGD